MEPFQHRSGHNGRVSWFGLSRVRKGSCFTGAVDTIDTIGTVDAVDAVDMVDSIHSVHSIRHSFGADASLLHLQGWSHFCWLLVWRNQVVGDVLDKDTFTLVSR